MSQLQLVKPLSRLREEQKESRISSIEIEGLTLLRGNLTELIGATSSGKTGYALGVLSKFTQEGEACVVIDASDSFDPVSAKSSGVNLENVLWVKCAGDIEKAMKAADLLVQAKGFGAVWINFSNVKRGQLSYVPNSFWYRFRTLVRESPTILLVTAKDSLLGSSAKSSFMLTRNRCVWKGLGKFKLIKEFRLNLKAKRTFTPVLSRIESNYEEV